LSDNNTDPGMHTDLASAIMLAHKIGWTVAWRRRDREGLPTIAEVFDEFRAYGADPDAWGPYLDDRSSGESRADIAQFLAGAFAAGCFDARMTPWHWLNALPPDLAGEVLAVLDGRPRRDIGRDFAAAVRSEISAGGKARQYQSSEEIEREALGRGIARDLTDADVERMWEAASRIKTGQGERESVVEFAIKAIRERIGRMLADEEGEGIG